MDDAPRGSRPPPSPPAGARREARRRYRADLAVIIASIVALVATIRIPPELMTPEAEAPVASVRWLLAAYALGGLLGIGGVIAAIRWPRPARFMVGAGGLALLSGFLFLEELTAVSLLSLGLTGLVLLVAAPFVGAMPSPEEEGKRR